MTDPSVTDGQAQVARFRVSQRALWLARLPALAMAASAIWLVFIPGRIEGNGSTSATVWLPKDRPTGLTRSQEFALYRTLHRSPYRPVERPDGMLLPLRLFGTAGARQIIDTLRRHLDMKEGG